jgi:hypothetical protein
VSARACRSEPLRAEIDEVFASSGDLAEALEQVARLGAPAAVAGRVGGGGDRVPGRDRYARAARARTPGPGCATAS